MNCGTLFSWHSSKHFLLWDKQIGIWERLKIDPHIQKKKLSPFALLDSFGLSLKSGSEMTEKWNTSSSLSANDIFFVYIIFSRLATWFCWHFRLFCCQLWSTPIRESTWHTHNLSFLHQNKHIRRCYLLSWNCFRNKRKIRKSSRAKVCQHKKMINHPNQGTI